MVADGRVVSRSKLWLRLCSVVWENDRLLLLDRRQGANDSDVFCLQGFHSGGDRTRMPHAACSTNQNSMIPKFTISVILAMYVKPRIDVAVVSVFGKCVGNQPTGRRS